MADCLLTGTIKDLQGNPIGGKRLTFTPISVTGELIYIGAKSVTSSAVVITLGEISITLIQGGYYNIKGNVRGFTDGGINVVMPDGDTANLIDLVSVASVPSTGMVIKSEGEALPGFYGTLNFIGATVTRPSAGVADIEITGGGGGASSLNGLSDVTITTPTNDDILQRKAGVFVNRSLAQLKADLSLSGVNSGDQDLSGYSLTGHTHSIGNVTGLQTALDAKLTESAANALYSLLAHNHDGTYEPVLGFTAVPTTRTVNGHALSANITIGKSDVGLGSVDNLQQLPLSYLDTDVLLTANSDVKVASQKAIRAYTDTAIANLLNSAPGALDTLDELAAALGDDPNFATTVTNSIATKLAKASNLSDLVDASAARTNLGLAIGSNVQAYNANLSTFAAIAPSANVQTLLGAANYAAFKASLSLGNVENTALSTWGGSANIATLGTITAGVWNGTDIALVNIAAASAASKLLGRGDSGAGDYQEITIGSGLTMTGTTLSASGGGTTINTSDGVLPYRSNSTTFADSPLSVASNAVLMTRSGIGATSSDGLVLTNATAAAVGAQQWSPRLRWHGSGWKTTATAAAQDVDWVAELVPVQGAANPSASLIFSASINGGAYASKFTLFSSGSVSSPGGGTSSEVFGAGATAAGLQSTCLGNGATAGAQDSVAIGQGCTTNGSNGLYSTSIGKSSGTNAASTVSVGNSAVTLAAGGVAIGASAQITAGVNSIVLGQGATTGNANTFIAGSGTGAINNVFFGKGETHATPTAYIINGTGGSGSNVAGADLKLAGGKGTGTGAGGAVIFQVAPAGSSSSGLNALAEAARINTNSVLVFPATMTAGGTTGAQTINKVSGSVNFAAGATSLVVTNDKVTANSIIIPIVAANDTTMKSCAYTVTAGSFTLFPDAAPTAETKVAFFVINQ